MRADIPASSTARRASDAAASRKYVNGGAPLPHAPTYEMLRALIERPLALLLVILFAPVLVVCAFIIKMTSPGPALFKQMRLGRGGRRYFMCKLRSMPHNIEATTGPVWSTPDDPRVTRFGRFLRDTHLDELPQLFNVVKGDMSLIGPRPERPEIVHQLERALPRYRERLLVRPGMTGLAQTQLPADSDLGAVRRKLAYDLHYVQHIGPWLDLRISASTVLHFVGLLFSTACRALTRSDQRAAEHRVKTIELLEDEVFEIGTS